MSNNSIWPIDWTLSGATTLDQSGPGNDGIKGVLCIPQSSSITGTSPSDCLVSYPEHLLGESYPSTEVQYMYFTALADWKKSIIIDDEKLHKPITIKEIKWKN